MDRQNRFSLHFFAIYLALLAAIGASGYHYYHDQQQRHQNEVCNQLKTVAELKVAQISAWRKEKLEDGALVQHHFEAMEGLQTLFKGPTVPSALVIDWLQAMKDHRGLRNSSIIDVHGNVRYSVSPITPLDEQCLGIVSASLTTRRVELSDLHVWKHAGAGHLTVAVPILAPPRESPLGVVLMETEEPGLSLYPVLQSWPTPNRTGEILLVRRDGDRFLVLNELRHRKDAAFRLTVPIHGVTNPTAASESAGGREGPWTGIDYRGKAVLAAALRVPDSPWQLISKVDVDETNTPVHEERSLALAILLLFVAAAAPAVGLLWYRQLSRIKDQRRESEVARHALVEHFSYLSRYANDIILLEDENGRIVEANERAELSYGYDHEELLGRDVRDLLEPLTLPEFDARWKAIQHDSGVLYETLHRRKDGTSFPVEVSARVIAVDGEVFRQSIIRDITERRHNEERIRRAGAYNRGLIEAALDPLVTINPNGMITDVNRATEKVTGYPREHLVGTDFSDYFLEPEKAHAGYLRAFREGEIRDYELAIRHRDGHLTPVMYCASVYRNKGGEVVGVIAAARDVTEQKRIQAAIEELNRELEQRVRQRTAELEAANQELEAFTYSVSHDLRAPLRAIKGFSRILVETHRDQLQAEARHCLDVVQQNSLQMEQLIEDLLTLSRLGRQPVRAQTVQPDAIVRAALETLGDEKKGRRVEFAVGELPPCQADPALLKQVFVNLLSNALKYSRCRATARIEIGWATSADLGAGPHDPGRGVVPDRNLSLASPVYYVRDNGVGFDTRYASKLFRVFERLHSRREFEGSGVGLAIVDRIIRRHGGRIWAEAEVGKGATFYFTIGNAR